MNHAVRRYARFYRGFWPRIAVFLGMALLQFALAAPIPFLVKDVFDTAIPDQRPGRLVALALVILALQAALTVLNLFGTNWMLGISTAVVVRLRQAVFDKLYAVSIRFHETTPIADLHDRVVRETERVDIMTRHGLAIALPSLIFALGILAVLVFINWVLFVITLAFVPLVYLVNRATRDALRRAVRRLHSEVETYGEVALNDLRTMRQTRILGAEQRARRRQDVVLRAAAEAARRQALLQRSHFMVNRMVIAVWLVLILSVGGAGVIDGRLSLGELFSFYAGLALIRQPLDLLVMAIPDLVAGREALLRVFELLDTADARPYSGDRELEVAGHLSVERVSFAYEEGRPVLVDASLAMEPGEIVALVGPNGSGKTTLAGLVVGFYKPSAGRITIDGVDYRDLDITYLRRQFGVLTEDPIMVAGTVMENITYGRPGVDEADVRRAVELAGAATLVSQLESGLDTPAYENGPLLSSGQLQRVALARAVLGHPRVLILDEPTTHLDVAGLRALVRGLRTLPDTPAMLLITHNADVAAMADSLYRVERGRIVRAVQAQSDGSALERDAG